MAHLVVQQRVNGEDRSLEQSCLQVRWHPWLAGEHRLEPEPRRVPADRLAEVEALGVSGLDRVRQGNSDLLRLTHGLRLSGKLGLLALALVRTLGLVLRPLGLEGHLGLERTLALVRGGHALRGQLILRLRRLPWGTRVEAHPLRRIGARRLQTVRVTGVGGPKAVGA